MFLTKSEIKELTGYARNTRQIEWLASHGYRFDVARSGVPMVLKSHIEERLGGIIFKNKRTNEPNFSNSKYFG